MKNTIRYLAVLGLAVLAWQLMPASSPQVAPSAATEAGDTAVPVARLTDDTARVHFAVAGMTCGSCAATARVVLDDLDGVYRSHVSYDSASATIWYDPAQVSPPVIIARLKEMTGYQATVTSGESE